MAPTKKMRTLVTVEMMLVTVIEPLNEPWAALAPSLACEAKALAEARVIAAKPPSRLVLAKRALDILGTRYAELLEDEVDEGVGSYGDYDTDDGVENGVLGALDLSSITGRDDVT